jgi:hypothetical protein
MRIALYQTADLTWQTEERAMFTSLLGSSGSVSHVTITCVANGQQSQESKAHHSIAAAHPTVSHDPGTWWSDAVTVSVTWSEGAAVNVQSR